MSEPKLKPCPCCGSRNVDFSPLWHYVIRCNDCGISTMMVTTRDEAIAIWNQRVNSEKEEENVRA